MGLYRRWNAVLPALLGLAGLFWPLGASAHGAGYERLPATDAVLLQFRYSIGEPMSDTDVVVQTPDGRRWQVARTDNSGHFAWLPDRPGRWRVTADDGLGHEVLAEVEVGPEAISAERQVRSVGLPPRLLYALLLASLVANVLLLIRRRSTPR